MWDNPDTEQPPSRASYARSWELALYDRESERKWRDARQVVERRGERESVGRDDCVCVFRFQVGVFTSRRVGHSHSLCSIKGGFFLSSPCTTLFFS